MERDVLAARLSEAARLSGSFRLRSGQIASVYFDKYQFESDPGLLAAVAEAMVDLVPDDIDLLAGLELGGVPVATALSLESGLPVVFVRKTAKEYGTAKLAEGPRIEGERLLVVGDVVTTGGQVALSTQQLRERGALVGTAACVIDREGGRRRGSCGDWRHAEASLQTIADRLIGGANAHQTKCSLSIDLGA